VPNESGDDPGSLFTLMLLEFPGRSFLQAISKIAEDSYLVPKRRPGSRPSGVRGVNRGGCPTKKADI
jgi:hypothetical protein